MSAVVRQPETEEQGAVTAWDAGREARHGQGGKGRTEGTAWLQRTAVQTSHGLSCDLLFSVRQKTFTLHLFVYFIYLEMLLSNSISE